MCRAATSALVGTLALDWQLRQAQIEGMPVATKASARGVAYDKAGFEEAAAGGVPTACNENGVARGIGCLTVLPDGGRRD